LPDCAFLKNVQSKLLQEARQFREILRVDEILELCNYYAWAMATVDEKVHASEIFLALIQKNHRREHRECSVCIRLEQEETLRTQELLASLDHRHVLEWIDKRGGLCILTRFEFTIRPLKAEGC
jgi:hypothetical protein